MVYVSTQYKPLLICKRVEKFMFIMFPSGKKNSVLLEDNIQLGLEGRVGTKVTCKLLSPELEEKGQYRDSEQVDALLSLDVTPPHYF